MNRPVLATILLIGRLAHAYWSDPHPEFRSPQHFAFELKFGPYSPDIDSTQGLTGRPFSDLFNNQLDPERVGKRPAGKLLTTIEFDWQIWRPFGSIGLAGSVGFMRQTVHSFLYEAGGSCTVPNCLRSSDTTALNVIPLALEAVYRFDVLALRLGIPIVPYLKGGVAYYLFWIENGGGGLAKAVQSDDQAIGGTFGLVAHPGIALLLDNLDSGAARTFDAEIGVNHSYLFFELNCGWITGFNSPGKIVLSDITWNAGLAFEF